jgi:hypothetical protein
MTKTCSRCGEEKDLRLFHRDSSKPDGHRAMCVDCVRTAQNARDHARSVERYRRRMETLRRMGVP